jgi:hypothetical protein
LKRTYVILQLQLLLAFVESNAHEIYGLVPKIEINSLVYSYCRPIVNWFCINIC